MGAALGVSREAFAAVFRETWRERFRGEFGDLSETISALAMRLGGSPSPSAIRLAEVMRLRFIRKLLWPPVQTMSVLERLREQGITLGVLSNCSVETAALWDQQPLSQRVHCAGLSCETGVMKPDPAFYLKVCGDLGVTPAECLYVGDGEDGELAAAAALGMRAIRTTQFADSDPAWTGETITDLRALSNIARV